MSKHTIHFSECEHEGDLDHYKDDLREAGATIISSEINHDAEEGSVVVEIKDKKAFLLHYQMMDSYELSNLYRY
jgi:translation elongation factor EF-Ts